MLRTNEVGWLENILKNLLTTFLGRIIILLKTHRIDWLIKNKTKSKTQKPDFPGICPYSGSWDAEEIVAQTFCDSFPFPIPFDTAWEHFAFPGRVFCRHFTFMRFIGVRGSTR